MTAATHLAMEVCSGSEQYTMEECNVIAIRQGLMRQYELLKVPAEAIIHGCNFAGCAGYSQLILL